MSLIDTILVDTKARLNRRKQERSSAELADMARDARRAKTSLRDAIEKAKTFTVIAEIKRKSPSGGKMDEANVSAALAAYHATPSVSAVSILTDEDHFGNTLADLRSARELTDKPLLRKDFIIDEYQVLEARAFGADAVLIMSGLHAADPELAARLVNKALDLKMDVLFEVSMMGLQGLPAQRALIRDDSVIWGINSRKFNTTGLLTWAGLGSMRAQIGSKIGKDLLTDREIHRELRSSIPSGQTWVAESGIKSPAYIHELRDMQYRAALIGTAFLKKGVSVSAVVGEFDREILGTSTSKTDATDKPHASGFPVPTA
jgi:indole-3-glycerol phosphate synthase